MDNVENLKLKLDKYVLVNALEVLRDTLVKAGGFDATVEFIEFRLELVKSKEDSNE
jgi:hypothetical protein